MVKIEFKASNGFVYCVNFDEQRIITENKLSGLFDQTIFDKLKYNPSRKNDDKLYNYGNGGWLASGTSFGQITAGARILFDPDKNQSQGEPHFTVQGIINISGSQQYSIPVGSAHRIISDRLEVIFYNFDGTISGTKVLTSPQQI